MEKKITKILCLQILLICTLICPMTIVANAQPGLPSIISITPSKAYAGDIDLTIKGNNFGPALPTGLDKNITNPIYLKNTKTLVGYGTIKYSSSSNTTIYSTVHLVTPGIYNVTINVTGPGPNGAQIFQTNGAELTVLGVLPEANFTSNVTYGYVPLTVQFKDLSKNAIGWNWDFGDGNKSTAQNPLHVYNKAGLFNVVLTASNSNGSSSKSMTISVSEKNTVTVNVVSTTYQYQVWGQYPLVNLFGEKDVPLTKNDPIWKCHVDKLAKLVIDSKSSYTLKTGDELDLGSGYSLEAKQIDIDGKKIWLEFDKDGAYIDDQIVSTDTGDHTWTCVLDKIQGEDNVPVLKVHVNQIFQGAVDSIAQIDGLWLIDYTNTTKLNIGNKFGNYTLTAINFGVDASNLGSLVFSSLSPPAIPVAAFSATPTSGNSPLTVQFTDKSIGSPTKWYWDFGDKTNSTTQNPTHTYIGAGNYTVKLIATNGAGSNQTIKSNYINVLKPVLCNTSTIYGYSFNDLNKNKKMDHGESGLSTMTISLNGYDTCKGTLVSTTTITNTTGYYSFSSVDPGVYVVSENFVIGWLPTSDTSYTPLTVPSKSTKIGRDFGNTKFTK